AAACTPPPMTRSRTERRLPSGVSPTARAATSWSTRSRIRRARGRSGRRRTPRCSARSRVTGSPPPSATAHGARARPGRPPGSHAMVYMNQRLWCTGTPSWTAEGAASWAVKERDGRVREEVYNVFDPQPCATMDVTTSFWRAKYAGIADTVLDGYGVDGIYMDQAVQSLVCWDPTHGHPVGGGNYWMGGFRALATQIRAAVQPGRPVLLAGEGAGEPWLPELDLML